MPPPSALLRLCPRTVVKNLSRYGFKIQYFCLYKKVRIRKLKESCSLLADNKSHVSL